MKRCPQCRRDYYDDSLLYCLEDGAALIQGSVPSHDEPATAILHETAPPLDSATRAQIHQTDQTDIRSSATASESRGSKRRLLVIPLAILIAVAGVAGYRYFLSASSGQISSIAVMPFVNSSGNSEIEYLSDGMTESLINNLSQLSNLSVKARSSVFRYKGKDVEPTALGNELSVQAVLNGRVLLRGDQLTLSLDLVDTRSGNQIWGDQYTRKIGDLAVMQSEIARDVSQKLRARLTGAEENRVIKNQTQNSEAYQLYLQGRYNWNKRTGPTTQKAIEFFQQAIEKDPTYAMAYVGLAESYMLTDLPADEVFPKIKAAALKALEIDSTLGEPHAALAAYVDTYELDHAEAEKEFKTAIELSPNYTTSYHWYAESLVSWGRIDEGLAVYKRALELDPFSLAIATDYGIALYYGRQYDQSIEYFKSLIEMDPNFVRTYSYIARVYQTIGRFEDALNAHEKRLLLQGNDPQEIARSKQAMLSALKTSGAKGYWSKALEFALKEGENVRPTDMARIYVQLGEWDEGFRWLERAFTRRIDADVFMIKVSPEWDAIRSDPRFKEMLNRRLRLPE